MKTVFEHQATPEWRRDAVARQKYPVFRQKNYFVAACLHQSQGIFTQWATELVKLLLAIAKDEHMGNLYVSVYQSGSMDQTAMLLSRFGQALDALGVRNTINIGTFVRGGMNRIEFLANVRNRAMKPIYGLADMNIDRVIWLSDNLFCASGPMQQIVLADDVGNGGAGADAACALDFDFMDGGRCGFYDIWAAHDYNGRNFMKPFPYVSHPDSRAAVEHNKPFQVFVCWSGMVVFRADIFTKAGLQYRRNRVNTGECPVAETELIFHDMWKIGRSRIVVAPNVPTAYGHSEYNSCVKGQQKEITFGNKVKFQTTVPPQFSCCPIEEQATFVNFGMCTMQAWSGPYKKSGIPRRKGFPMRRLRSLSSWPDDTVATLLPFAPQRHNIASNSTAESQRVSLLRSF